MTDSRQADPVPLAPILEANAQWIDALANAMHEGVSIIVEPSSKVASDDALVGGGLMTQTVQILLAASMDAMRLLIEVRNSRNGPGVAAWAVLARACLESASLAWWLVEASQQVDRCTRLLRLQREDAKNQRQFGGDPSEHQGFDADLQKVAERLAVDFSEIRKSVKFSSILAELDDACHGEYLKTWQVLSGISHGRRWAWTVGTVPTYLARTERGHSRHLNLSLEFLDTSILIGCSALSVAVDAWNAAASTSLPSLQQFLSPFDG